MTPENRLNFENFGRSLANLGQGLRGVYEYCPTVIKAAALGADFGATLVGFDYLAKSTLLQSSPEFYYRASDYGAETIASYAAIFVLLYGVGKAINHFTPPLDSPY